MGLRKIQQELQQQKEQDNNLMQDLTTALEQVRAENSNLQAELTAAFKQIQDLATSDLQLKQVQQLMQCVTEKEEKMKLRSKELNLMEESNSNKAKELLKKEQDLNEQLTNLQKNIQDAKAKAELEANRALVVRQEQLDEFEKAVEERENKIEKELEDCRVEVLKTAEDNFNSRMLAVRERENAVAKREYAIKQDVSKRVDEAIEDTLKYLNVVILVFIWLIIFIGLKSGFWKSVADIIENYFEVLKVIYVYWSEPELTLGCGILLIISELLVILLTFFVLIFSLLGYCPIEQQDGSRKSFFRAGYVGIGAFIVVFGGDLAAIWFIGGGFALCIIRLILLSRY